LAGGDAVLREVSAKEDFLGKHDTDLLVV